jgi:heme a synthase
MSGESPAAVVALVDFAPAARLALLALVVALLPLSYVWLRSRHANAVDRLAALTALTLFLTFDLIVFGAFTRLSDSGLGCPDWPGCYGQASPLGAVADIRLAEQLHPTGPVSWSKAWIEMIHRYLAMTVGVLILVMALVSWLERRRLPHSPWLPTFTLLWVVVQGLFGKYTVTLKLYPAIVTLHLLGGLLLLALLVVQHEAFRARPLRLSARTRRWATVTLMAIAVQVALGGWVSTNYAVLACREFPLCNGQWWPQMDLGAGFSLLRELGRDSSGGALGAAALVAIHMVHRWFAVIVTIVTIGLVHGLWREPGDVPRRFAWGIGLLLLAQLLSGLSNVVLGWPLAAALAHSAGAAALVMLAVMLLSRGTRLATA